MKNIALIAFLILASITLKAQDMTKQKMAKILGKETTILETSERSWQVRLDQITLVIIIDENANRMRVISPAAYTKDLKKKDYVTLLEANYHSALDAKYAIDGEYVWSTYVHPLKELSEEQFIDALYQVRNLVYTYGGSYTSTNLVFGK